jgi:hypothetical protein
MSRYVAWNPSTAQLVTTVPPVRLIVAETPEERDELRRLFGDRGFEVIPFQTVTVTEWLRESGAQTYANGDPLPPRPDGSHTAP